MAERIGNVLYWAGCGLAALWAILWVYIVAAGQAGSEPFIFLGLGAVGAVVIWLIGRAAKYVLVGK